jgi:hypothetical protein
MPSKATPLVDNRKVTAYWIEMENMNRDYVDADFARTLERMCAELAEALENHMFMTRPRDESKEALARYSEMMKGVVK